jgi:G:T/U mismatch-specific DNA glycosylase
MSGNKDKLKCFSPLTGKNPKILILGTMPGGESLKKQEYYAYSRNVFWKLLFEVLNKPFKDSYKDRVNLIKNNAIALWDTLLSCERKNSSDSKIKKGSEVYNDIYGLLKKNKSIRAVFFTSKTAEKYFEKGLDGKFLPLEIHREYLPSPSPANTVKYEKKLEQWLVIKDFL